MAHMIVIGEPFHPVAPPLISDTDAGNFIFVRDVTSCWTSSEPTPATLHACSTHIIPTSHVCHMHFTRVLHVCYTRRTRVKLLLVGTVRDKLYVRLNKPTPARLHVCSTHITHTSHTSRTCVTCISHTCYTHFARVSHSCIC